LRWLGSAEMRKQKDSIIKNLKEKKILNEELETLISQLALEELIMLKLEISSRKLGNRLFGFPIWKNIDYIIKDSIIKFAVNRTSSIREAAAILNTRPALIKNFIHKYGLTNEHKFKKTNTE
jgi:hypothetical protein